MEHRQETHDTPCWQKHNGEVHQVVREEVDAPGRQVETHTIIDREKRPQYHLENIEDAVKWCANARAYNGCSVGNKVQDRGNKKRFIGAAFPFGEPFFAAGNLRRRSLCGWSAAASAKAVFSGSGTVRVCGVSVPFASAILPSPYMLFVEAGLL